VDLGALPISCGPARPGPTLGRTPERRPRANAKQQTPESALSFREVGLAGECSPQYILLFTQDYTADQAAGPASRHPRSLEGAAMARRILLVALVAAMASGMLAVVRARSRRCFARPAGGPVRPAGPAGYPRGAPPLVLVLGYNPRAHPRRAQASTLACRAPWRSHAQKLSFPRRCWPCELGKQLMEFPCAPKHHAQTKVHSSQAHCLSALQAMRGWQPGVEAQAEQHGVDCAHQLPSRHAPQALGAVRRHVAARHWQQWRTAAGAPKRPGTTGTGSTPAPASCPAGWACLIRRDRSHWACN
jgi:hypothetical protein